MDTNNQLEERKKCTRCKVNLKLDQFKQKRDDTYQKQCMKCNESKSAYYRQLPAETKKKYLETRDSEKHEENRKRYYDKNRDDINAKRRENGKELYEKIKEKELERGRKRNENPEYKLKCKEYNRIKYQNNKEHITEINNKYREEHKDECRERQRNWKKQKRQNDEQFRILGNMRSRICDVLRGCKSKTTKEYLGCTSEEFRKHIEEQFRDGMTWENYGEWHIDHITPLKYGEPTFEEVVERLHYKNTQPLWARENISKGNRFIG